MKGGVASAPSLLLILWLLIPLSGLQAPPAVGHNVTPQPSIPRTVGHSLSQLTGTEQVNPYSGYSAEPAPMGIADYGIGQSGAYQYATNSSWGEAYIVSLSTRNSTGGTEMSIQLNVNLHFSDNNKQYVYWVQDVCIIDTSSGYIYFDDNIWNSSSSHADMSASSISGSGGVYPSSSGNYYGVVASSSLAGNYVNLHYPATVDFRVNSTVSASGRPQVTFEYSDGYGWKTFDVATFSVTRLTSLSGFVVDGFSYNPRGVYDDAELVLGGPYSGYGTTDIQSDVRLQLKYWNGHNYQAVQNAYNFGGDTAEAIDGVLAEAYYYINTGEMFSKVLAGSGAVDNLYYQSHVSTIDIRSSLSAGILYISNASVPSATPSRYPYSGGEVIVTVYPGTYLLQLYQGASLYSSGKFTVVGGQYLQTLLGQVGLTISYSVSGGGSGYSGPTLTYAYGGVRQVATIGTSPTTYYVDTGSTWQVSSTLPGSASSERWASAVTSGTASTSETMNLVYYHQYSIMVSYAAAGGSPQSSPSFSYRSLGSAASATLATSSLALWADSGGAYAAANPLPGSNSGERWFSTAPNGTISAPGFLSLTYDHQYYLSVTGGDVSSQWYNSGSLAELAASGTYSRAAGKGLRILSYALDGGSPVVVTPTTGQVNVQLLMDTPHSVAFASVAQYQASLGPSASKAVVSMTPPTIGGDVGWYDSGTDVQIVSNYVWGLLANESRTNAVAYVLDGTTVPLPRAGTGTFDVGFAMNGARTFNVTTVTQYHLSVSGGRGFTAAPPSPTGDGFYDSGSASSVSTSYSWNVVSGQSRENIVSYSLDGLNESVQRAGSGNLTIPQITFDGPHSLTFDSVKQYFITFVFTDASGSTVIAPASFEITINGAGPAGVQNGTSWLDSGANVGVSRLVWQGLDVMPESFSLSVNGAQTVDIRARVFTAGLMVADPFGLPVSGASASIVLVNGTTLQRVTGADGTIELGLIPLGTYRATVSYLGQSVQVAGDASRQSVTTAQVFLSYPVIGAVVSVTAILALAAVLKRRSRRASGSSRLG